MNLPYDGRKPEPPYECPACVEKDRRIVFLLNAMDGRDHENIVLRDHLSEKDRRIAELEKILSGTLQAAGKKAFKDEDEIEILKSRVAELEQDLDTALNSNSNHLG